MAIDIESFKKKVQEEYERNMAADPRQIERLAAHECKACFYEVTFSGQAFTPYTCGMCQLGFMHNNTGVPKLCPNCADKNVLCAQCAKPRD